MSETATPTVNGEIVGRMKAKIKDLARRLKAAEDKATDAINAANAAKVQYDTEPLKVENERLKGEIRTDRHKAAFSRIAKESKVKEKAVDALFQLSGWKTDSDKVNEDAMREAIEGLREAHDYAFDAEAESGDPDREDDRVITPGSKPVPGAGRGKPHQPAKSGIVIGPKELADPKFMLNPKNKELIQSAAKEGRIRLPNREGQ